jgi:hypothetical protein
LVFALSCAAGNENPEPGRLPDSDPGLNSDSNSNGGGGADPAGKDEADPFDPMLPDEDFEEYQFKILNVDESAMPWAIVKVSAEEHTGDVVDNAIYLRNRSVEGKYNINITETAMPPEDVNGAIRRMSQGGTDDFDLFITLSDYIAIHASAGHLANLNNLIYVNLDRPWWNQNTRRNFSIGGKLFFVTSDFILTDNENLATLAYNKKIADDIGLPTADEMYELTLEGGWTWDKFTEMCKSAYLNLDGTGAINYSTDRFGVVSAGWWFGSAVMSGFNEPVIRKDENDMPFVAARTDRYFEAYAAMIEFFRDREAVARTSVDFQNNLEYIFERDGALFAGTMFAGYRIMRGMETNFGLLPFPKWDAAQDNYYTFASVSTAIGVPALIPDPDRSGFIIEALSAESARLLTPAYYEKALSLQYLRDEGSIKMLDIILANQVHDIMYTIYNWAGFTDTLREAMMGNNANIASLLDRHEPRIISAMQRTIDAYESLD